MNNKTDKEVWGEISSKYMEYQSKVISGEIPVDSSFKLWVFDWLSNNYYPPIEKTFAK